MADHKRIVIQYDTITPFTKTILKLSKNTGLAMCIFVALQNCNFFLEVDCNLSSCSQLNVYTVYLYF